jgi:hypothetical protein
MSVIGGVGWQSANYGQNTVGQGTQNTAVGFVAAEIKAFNFKKTNLDPRSDGTRDGREARI